ncbi:MAG: trypsin-like serine peptidase [Jatrophihabitans sp.]|uniref:trypsin-like serine peptidase n=1 Tax=Jatrophihabitans sp. TaxID=1932789 RepID=UPI003F7E53BB
MTCAVLGALVVALGLTTVVVVRRAPSEPRAAAAPLHSTGARPARPRSADVSASAMPVSTVAAEQTMVGPLFRRGLGGTHSCTAIVVASGSGDTVLTAAHCVSGSARGWLFAPGYDRGATPKGVWTVTGQYVPTGWLDGEADADDFAVLTVADRTVGGRRVSLASVTGAAGLGTTPPSGTEVRVVGYNAGREDTAATCVVPLRSARGHPTLSCHGFRGGSSGSPWLLADAAAPTVVGLIGGRHHGGCTEFTSHSPVFTAAVAALVQRAAAGGRPDDVPRAGSDDCPSG